MRGAWTPKAALRRTRKHIETACKALTAAALEWGDVDEGIVAEMEGMIAELQRIADETEAGVNERIAAGEHVGL